MIALKYPFTEAQLHTAAKEWGCNCGPSALAFIVQQPLDLARCAIPDFDEKRYTSPSMMKQALAKLGLVWSPAPSGNVWRGAMFDYHPALVRIQFTGPWRGKWAYWHTHWITCWCEASLDGAHLVFDCNGGVLPLAEWESDILPHLLPKRGDGKWHPTHIWYVRPSSLNCSASPCLRGERSEGSAA